ncbi:MAG: HDOD domain-containing protein [Bryobacterales bacterium]|nr:HDOD domain-containing protein [Bryobacterales bacterium]
MHYHVGDTVGAYRVIAEMARGGTEQLLKVEHTLTRRVEAMQVVDAGAATQFLEDIQRQSRLAHPNIAAVHNAFTDRGELMLVMELVEGEPLSRKSQAARLSTGQAVDYAIQVLDALEYAHRQGVFHGDLTPASIVVAVDGKVKLTGFRGADAATDLRAAAAVLRELLPGPPPPKVQEAMDRARSERPEVRFRTAGEFRDALRLAVSAAPGPPAAPVAAAEDPLHAALARIESDPNFPGCAHHIRGLMALSASPEVSAQTLAAIVRKDVALTLRILKAANSAYYNRSGRPVLSITQAVVLLGVETVAQVASGMKILDHYARHAPGVRELAAFSLLTASQARRIAEAAEFPRPEEAYLCALLRNLGEVLVAYYQPREYARIVAARTTPREVLGFNYEELAVEVLRRWGIGGSPAAAIRANPQVLLRQPPGLESKLYLITAFSHLAAHAVHRAGPEAGDQALIELIEHFRPRLSVGEKALRKVLEDAVEDARDTMTALGLSLDSLTLQSQVRAATSWLGEDTGHAPPAEQPSEFIVRIENALQDDGEFDLTSVVTMALEAAVRAAGFERAVFALVDADSGRVQGKLGFGPEADRLADGFSFAVSPRGGPVGLAVFHKQDAYVHLGRDAAARDSLVARLFGPALFLVAVVVVRGVAAGCLYCDALRGHPEPSAAQRDIAGRLRDLTALAIDRSRNGTGIAL